MQVEAAIDEADVGRLRVGQEASFTVDAFPRRAFAGQIRQIRKSPQNVQNVISYTVVISAANPEQALLPGMTANVRVVTDKRENVLKVPNAALRYRPAAGRLWIVGENARPVPVTVRTGLSDGASTEIVEGPLKEGDEVILGAADAPAAKKAGGGPRMF
jgi:HlyD family secretion protein